MEPRIDQNLGISGEPDQWEEAMNVFIDRFRDAWSRGHNNLACYNSGQLTIEEFYTLGKLWRGGLKSSNIDGNTRLCTATSGTGPMSNFGVDGPVASYVDIDQAELICIFGLLLHASHPPASATTLLVALGGFRLNFQTILIVSTGVLLIGVLGEGLRGFRLGKTRFLNSLHGEKEGLRKKS